MWRNETMGSYFLVFNAILNFDHLDAGSTAQAPSASAPASATDHHNEDEGNDFLR
jgi:hypothetical protein